MAISIDHIQDKVEKALQKAQQSKENWEIVLTIGVFSGGIKSFDMKEIRETRFMGKPIPGM